MKCRVNSKDSANHWWSSEIFPESPLLFCMRIIW